MSVHNVRIHPTAVVEDGASIGDGTSVWWKLVMGAASLGGHAEEGGTLVENVRTSFERSDEYFQQIFGRAGACKRSPAQILAVPQ